MKTINDILQKLRVPDKEEVIALNYAKQNNNIPFRKDLAQVLQASTLLKEGTILIKKHPRFCSISKHGHNYLEISYVLSGSVTQIIDNSKVTLKKGELIFISRNSIHEFLPCNEDDIMINFIILPAFFDFIFPFIDKNGNIKKFLINLLSNKDESNSIIFRLSDCVQVQNIIENILISFDEKPEVNNNLLRYYFLLLIYELLKHTDRAEETKSSNYDSVLLFKTYNYIENNYSSATLTAFANSLNEDYNYISKKIKKLTGLPFQKILENERIRVAKSLLASTDINIMDIAYHVGYSNQTFFYELFKKATGQTPSNYRLQNKNIDSD